MIKGPDEHTHDRAQTERDRSSSVARELDFIARLADAWNLNGNHIFRATLVEHRALTSLAQLPDYVHTLRWEALTPEQRYKIVFAARTAIEFGRQCAWIFGEGTGARS